MASGDKNEAHAPLKLPGWWPEVGGRMRFPTDDSLPSSAKALRGHLDALDMAMRDIADNGLVTAADVGNWDAGQTLAQAVNAAHTHISDVHRAFQEQLEVVARLLVTNHEGHDNVEHESTRESRRLSGQVPDPPTTQPTRQSTPSID